MFGPDHLAGLRPGSNHQPWAPAAAGAFGTLAGPGPGPGWESGPPERTSRGPIITMPKVVIYI